MTLEFDNSRTTYKTGSPVRILRVPAGGIESACIICDNAVQHGVHWFHDRTVPHFDEKECPYCEDAETLRREWYLSVWIPAWNWVRIIAITDFAMHPVITHREREGGLRGTECDSSGKTIKPRADCRSRSAGRTRFARVCRIRYELKSTLRQCGNKTPPT